MKTPKTLRRETYKGKLSKLLETNEEAKKVDRRYDVMRYLLNFEWGNTLSQINKDILNEILQDVIYIDRQIRYQTEGEDQERKDELEEEKLKELNYK